MPRNDEFTDACVLHNFARGLWFGAAAAAGSAKQREAEAAADRAVSAGDRAEKSALIPSADEARAAHRDADDAARDAKAAHEAVCAIATAVTGLADRELRDHALWHEPARRAERAGQRAAYDVGRAAAAVERAVTGEREAAARRATADLVCRAYAAVQRADTAATAGKEAADSRDTNRACAAVRDAQAASQEAAPAWREAVLNATASLGLASLADADAAMRDRESTGSYVVRPAHNALDEAERFLMKAAPGRPWRGADEQARDAVRRAEEAARRTIAEDERAAAASRYRWALAYSAPARDENGDDDWDLYDDD